MTVETNTEESAYHLMNPQDIEKTTPPPHHPSATWPQIPKARSREGREGYSDPQQLLILA